MLTLRQVVFQSYLAISASSVINYKQSVKTSLLFKSCNASMLMLSLFINLLANIFLTKQYSSVSQEEFLQILEQGPYSKALVQGPHNSSKAWFIENFSLISSYPENI